MKIIMVKYVDIKVCVYLIMNEYQVIVDYDDLFSHVFIAVGSSGPLR